MLRWPLFVLPILFFALSANESTQAAKNSINITELTLNNGMKAVLKPTKFDVDEFFVRVSALKGYINLPEKLRPSAQLLHEIIWESGIGSMSGDQLSVYIFEKELEIDFRIAPAERYIEGEGNIESAPILFGLIKDLFLTTRVEQDQLQVIRDRLKESINRQSCDKSCQFDAFYKSVVTNNYQPFKPIAVDGIDLITQENAQKVLLGAFHDPSEFVAVVVGDFEIASMTELLQKTIGTIPIAKGAGIWSEQSTFDFPSGTETKTLPQGTDQDALTRITFPIVKPIDDSNVRVLDLMTETIEARLRQALQERYKESFGLDVSYDFPFYPFMDKPRITIQFRAEQNQAITKLILDQLNDLKVQGAKDSDYELAELLEAQSGEYWSRDNHFWVTILSQYYMMGWDQSHIVRNYIENGIEKNQINTALKEFFPLDNYTIVTGGS